MDPRLTTDPPPTDVDDDVHAPGNSAVEVAARRGFGPLSRLSAELWHGDSRPCVSCGQLARRTATRCDACGEDLSVERIRRMRDFAGPWYVLEHVRPFPGVTWERLVRQIRRGVLTKTTIVRGPGTDHQWRYAGETPGLCKYLGACWNCQAPATLQESRCVACGVDLGTLSNGSAEIGTRSMPQEPPATEDPRLTELTRAVRASPQVSELEPEASRLGPVPTAWIVVAIVVTLITVLISVVKIRDEQTRPPPPVPARRA